MGIKERRLFHKQTLRQNIIAAAQTIFKEEGSWQGVTIRKIATTINYSLPTIYEYFENKNELLKVLQQEGYATLCSILSERLQQIRVDPYEVLTIVAQVYWDFALECPELYQIMHNQTDPLSDHKESIFFIRTTVQQALEQILHQGKKVELTQQEMNDNIDAMRGIIHGFIMLALIGSMEKKHAHTLMMQTLHNTIRSGYQG